MKDRDIFEQLNKERESSDKKYAIKLVEIIVFTLLGMAFIGLCGYVWKNVATKPTIIERTQP